MCADAFLFSFRSNVFDVVIAMVVVVAMSARQSTEWVKLNIVDTKNGTIAYSAYELSGARNECFNLNRINLNSSFCVCLYPVGRLTAVAPQLNAICIDFHILDILFQFNEKKKLYNIYHSGHTWFMKPPDYSSHTKHKQKIIQPKLNCNNLEFSPFKLRDYSIYCMFTNTHDEYLCTEWHAKYTHLHTASNIDREICSWWSKKQQEK